MPAARAAAPEQGVPGLGGITRLQADLRCGFLHQPGRDGAVSCAIRLSVCLSVCSEECSLPLLCLGTAVSLAVLHHCLSPTDGPVLPP